jgi:hypothetical protein
MHERDGFMSFLLSLPRILDSMLLPHPMRLGNGFDMIDLQRYSLTVDDFNPERNILAGN